MSLFTMSSEEATATNSSNSQDTEDINTQFEDTGASGAFLGFESGGAIDEDCCCVLAHAQHGPLNQSSLCCLLDKCN